MQSSPKVVEAVDSLLEQFSNAVSRHDPKAVLALFAEDPNIAMLGSEKREIAIGRKEFGRFLQRVLSRPETYSWKWKRKMISIRGNVAWITAEGSVIVRKGSRENITPYRLTGVFEKRKAKWLWMHYHGSEPV